MDKVGQELFSERQRDEIIVPLRAGVVPRVGLERIQVGRHEEMKSLRRDLDKVSQGGVCFRLVKGESGAGKTFLRQALSHQARQQGLVVASVDLSARHRFTGRGQGKNLYNEIVRSLSTRSRPDGVALTNIVERFVFSAIRSAHGQQCSPHEIIETRLKDFEELAGGFDFIEVIRSYWQGLESSNEHLKKEALAWLQGKFGRLSEARKSLNVRSIINGQNYFDVIKMLAQFIRFAGYKGLLLNIDEVAVITLLPATTRNKEYEQILFIFNDLMQGSGEGLGLVLYSTPPLMHDVKKGIPSHCALYGRLSPNPFVESGWEDFSAPVLSLAPLAAGELVQLLFKLRHIFSYGDELLYPLDDDGIHEFIDTYNLNQPGGQNTRAGVRLFLDYLAVREFNQISRVQPLPQYQDSNAEVF